MSFCFKEKVVLLITYIILLCTLILLKNILVSCFGRLHQMYNYVIEKGKQYRIVAHTMYAQAKQDSM